MMTYNMKDLVKGLNNLVKVETKAATKAVQKAVAKPRPALLSFDEVESMAVPGKRSAQIILSGPTLEEDMVNDSTIEITLDIEAQDIVGEMVQSLREDMRRVLK